MSQFPPPRRSLGQNFLIDRAAIRRIVESLDPQPDETVLEIGPGRGALTMPLLERAGRVVVVERDRALAARWRESQAERLEVIEADILDVDLAALRERVAGAGRLVVAGNLPYNISKPVAMQMIGAREHVERGVLMFQREVAARLTARPASREYGPLSVLAGAAFVVRRAHELGPGAFRPRPKVSSTVTHWTPRRPTVPETTLAPLAACLSACFAGRRRTLRNNLRATWGETLADELLARAALDGRRRAETLTPVEFAALASIWPPG